MDGGCGTLLKGHGSEEKDNNVVDLFCIVQLERKLVDIHLLQVCLHLFVRWNIEIVCIHGQSISSIDRLAMCLFCL